MDRLVFFLNGLWIVIYCTVIAMAFGLQIFEGEQPCPLCYMQRVAMISISTAALMNLFYGIRMVHYAMALFASLVGGIVAFRQISLHICPGFPQFGEPFWGISLYSWSFITFVCSVFMTGVLLTLYRPSQSIRLNIGMPTKILSGYLLLIILGNIASVLMECGLGVCE